MSMPTGTVPADATAPRSRWRRITRAVARLLAMLALVCAVGTAGYVVYGALPGETRRATAASHTAEVLAQPLPPPPASTARAGPALEEGGGGVRVPQPGPH